MSNRRKLPRDKDKLVLSDRVQAYVDRLDSYDEGARCNGYLCGTCNRIYVTVDIDPGVTPMFMRCFATEGCPGQASSLGYPAGPIPAGVGQPVLEWYRPETTAGENPAMVDHLRNGGLAHRPASTAPDWVKALHA